MILSRDELRDLTSRATRKTIRAQLDALGIRYGLGVDGWPVVLRESVVSALGGKKEGRRKTEPMFDSLT